MIRIRINGDIQTIANDLSLAAVLKNLGYDQEYFAVAINKNFIPRTAYATSFFNEDDCVDIVMPMQGG